MESVILSMIQRCAKETIEIIFQLGWRVGGWGEVRRLQLLIDFPLQKKTHPVIGIEHKLDSWESEFHR